MPQRIVQHQRSRNHRPVRLVGRKHGKRARICKKTRHVTQRSYRRIIHHRMGIVEVKSVGKWLQYATVMPTRSSATRCWASILKRLASLNARSLANPAGLPSVPLNGALSCPETATGAGSGYAELSLHFSYLFSAILIVNFSHISAPKPGLC